MREGEPIETNPSEGYREQSQDGLQTTMKIVG